MFAPPLLKLRDTIREDQIKELLVVFLTDGKNRDKPETLAASQALSIELSKIYSKFNVIGFGKDFDVDILESLVKAGTQPGVISCDLDEAFNKISQKFEHTPSTKIFIPG